MFSSGALANAICDRCGMRFPYLELSYQTVNSVETKLLVCQRCMDIDHEQYQVGRLFQPDAQALQDARPEPNLSELRGLFGWDPVLGQALYLNGGEVRIP